MPLAPFSPCLLCFLKPSATLLDKAPHAALLLDASLAMHAHLLSPTVACNCPGPRFPAPPHPQPALSMGGRPWPWPANLHPCQAASYLELVLPSRTLPGSCTGVEVYKAGNGATVSAGAWDRHVQAAHGTDAWDTADARHDSHATCEWRESCAHSSKPCLCNTECMTERVVSPHVQATQRAWQGTQAGAWRCYRC